MSSGILGCACRGDHGAFCSIQPYDRLVSMGLQFQIEQHLFVHISHVYYPALSTIVATTCQEYALPYVDYPTVWTALAGHSCCLQQMGKQDTA